MSRARGSEQRRLYLPSFSLVICGVPAQRAIFSVAGTKGRVKTGTESVSEGSDPGKESKQTPAGRGRTLTREGIRSPPRAARTQEPRGWQEPHGRQRAVGSAAEFASGPPRPRLARHFDPECSTQEPQDGSLWRTAGHRLGFPGPPTGAVAEPWLSRPPDTPTSARAPPPPIGPLRPPRARGGGSGVSRRHCSPSSALHHIRKEKHFFTRRGRGRGLQPRGARGREDPRGEEGWGGGEKEGRWPGQGVGGEGSRTAAAAASSPRPPQLFVQPRAVPAPSPSGPTTDSTGEDAPRSWGPAAPSSPLLASRKQT